MTDKRLIEAAFPLEQVSIDAVHEKNVRPANLQDLVDALPEIVRTAAGVPLEFGSR